MKRIVLPVIFLVATALSAHAQQYPEALFSPKTQFYDVNVSTGKLTLWNVGEAGGLELIADPTAGSSKLGIATCVTYLENARKEGIRVGIGFDPSTRIIVYCGKPRT